MALVIGIKAEILVARRMKLTELRKDLWSLDYQIWKLERYPLLVNSYAEQKDGPPDTVSLKRELEEKRRTISEEIEITRVALENIGGEINLVAPRSLLEPKSETA
ncbi:MAG: hypothetical protein AAB428_02460 [Patescibacteria group bacterium]